MFSLTVLKAAREGGQWEWEIRMFTHDGIKWQTCLKWLRVLGLKLYFNKMLYYKNNRYKINHSCHAFNFLLDFLIYFIRTEFIMLSFRHLNNLDTYSITFISDLVGIRTAKTKRGDCLVMLQLIPLSKGGYQVGILTTILTRRYELWRQLPEAIRRMTHFFFSSKTFNLHIYK